MKPTEVRTLAGPPASGPGSRSRGLKKMWEDAMALNKQNILKSIDVNPNARILDLGCDDGSWSRSLAAKSQCTEILGIDIVEQRLAIARQRQILTCRGDLRARLPFANESIDIIHADQVIEHVETTDVFIAEMWRVLTKSGYCVVSTENLASWCNIASLVLGWQPFSVTNISEVRLGVGNPLALYRGAIQELKSWLHVRVVAVRALTELFELHGFHVEHVYGAGYFPLPAILGSIDVRHSHFITIRARKK